MCVGWDIKVPPPKQMVVNVGASLKVILLKFGTCSGACFKFNHLGHFAKDCKVDQGAVSEEKSGDQPREVCVGWDIMVPPHK